MEAERRDMIVSYLDSQGLQIGKEAAIWQNQQLVPREVELPQHRETQSETVEVVVTQIQNL